MSDAARARRFGDRFLYPRIRESPIMRNHLVPALLASLTAGGTALAGPLALTPADRSVPPIQQVAAPGPNLGGGFIEMLFGGSSRQQPQRTSLGGYDPSQYYQPSDAGQPQGLDPRYLKQEVDYDGTEAAGTIIINTPERFLYLVEGNGRALRYGIGVGRPGFTWAGVHNIT